MWGTREVLRRLRPQSEPFSSRPPERGSPYPSRTHSGRRNRTEDPRAARTAAWLPVIAQVRAHPRLQTGLQHQLGQLLQNPPSPASDNPPAAARPANCRSSCASSASGPTGPAGAPASTWTTGTSTLASLTVTPRFGGLHRCSYTPGAPRREHPLDRSAPPGASGSAENGAAPSPEFPSRLPNRAE